MRSVETRDDREEMTISFERLLKQYKQNKARIATKEEEVAKSKDWALVAKTTNYTVDNIVNGMASLQLSFGNIIGELAETLTSESYKLEELKKAIAVEREHLERLKQIRLVAHALYVLEREQEAKKADLATHTAQTKADIVREIAAAKQEWEIEQTEFLNRVKEATASLTYQRELEAADYQYELEHQRTIERDEYETDKRLQEIKIVELETAKNTDWSEREKYLQLHKTEFTKHQEAIALEQAKTPQKGK